MQTAIQLLTPHVVAKGSNEAPSNTSNTAASGRSTSSSFNQVLAGEMASHSRTKSPPTSPKKEADKDTHKDSMADLKTSSPSEPQNLPARPTKSKATDSSDQPPTTDPAATPNQPVDQQAIAALLAMNTAFLPITPLPANKALTPDTLTNSVSTSDTVTEQNQLDALATMAQTNAALPLETNEGNFSTLVNNVKSNLPASNASTTQSTIENGVSLNSNQTPTSAQLLALNEATKSDASKINSALDTSITPSTLASQQGNSTSSLTTDMADTLIKKDTSIQSVQSAHQGLSENQLNAIAPVLTAPTSGLTTPASSEKLAPQVGTPEWGESLGQKITWMVAGGQQSASLTLNPPDLGPLQVVLSVNNQHANATFISHQPEVRAALEDAIPKLREMMGNSGIQLGQCNVNSQAKQQEFAQPRSNSRSNGAALIGSVSGTSMTQSSLIQSGNGMVDTFV